MKQIQRILAATDFSPLGDAAVDRAAMLAVGNGSALRVVHAFPRPGAFESLLASDDVLSPRLRAAARESLDRLVRRTSGDSATASIDADILEGSASEVISKSAADFGADLIVIGAHAQGALQQFFLGGTASRILARARCPVLVVRQPAQSRYKSVLAAVDLGPDSGRVVDAALALSRDGAITVAHASLSLFDSRLHYRSDSAEQLDQMAQREAEKATERMKALVSAYASAGRSLQIRVVRGHPNPVLFDLAAETRAELIVALRHKGSRIGEDILGSIARLLAYNAPCDVLLA